MGMNKNKAAKVKSFFCAKCQKGFVLKKGIEDHNRDVHTECTSFCRLCFNSLKNEKEKSWHVCHEDEDMEISGQMVEFPLMIKPIESNYSPCTIAYRFPSDDPKKSTSTELSWINVFLNSVPSLKKRAEEDDSVTGASLKAQKFAQRYTKILENLKKDPEIYGGPPDYIQLCRIREQILRKVGFKDVFKKVKEEENSKAIALFGDIVRFNDDIQDESKRVEHLIKGVLAGSVYDLGSAQFTELFSNDPMSSFQGCCQNLVSRPWVIDDLDKFVLKWAGKKLPWKKALIFVDNSGADLILGILPFARELLWLGTEVVLAANHLACMNNVTYTELVNIISKLTDENGKLMGVDTCNLLIANSGNNLPGINLTSISQELANLANDADLVVLEGSRGIETNLYAQFTCDSLNIGMVKQPEVAQFLGGRNSDCVLKFN